MTSVIDEIAAERRRQIEVYWHDPRNDASRERRTEALEGHDFGPPRRPRSKPSLWQELVECLKWRVMSGGQR